MDKHVTMKLLNKEDFDSLMKVINSAGFKVLYADVLTLKIECHIDDFLLSLSQLYLDVEIFDHRNRLKN